MAEVKTVEGATVTLLNKGQRSFDLPFVNGQPVGKHAPGTTHTYSAEQAARLAGYPDLIDVTKVPGSVDTRALQSENATLKAEREALKAQLAALTPKTAEQKKAEKEAQKASEAAAKSTEAVAA